MKRNVKNWTKAVMALALGAGMLSFAAPQASAQSRNQRFENEQLQERNRYSNRTVNSHHQHEQRGFTYQQPYQQHGYGQYGYGQYGYGQYGQYGTPPQPYYPNQNSVRHDDDDDLHYQRNNRR